ncbi:hypothetical protein BJ322DRAFT_1037327 [Thelephora terrestris]|uniref:Mid2 domain-containing protein n=1 Tax=Thelephora terrestris TaxID=56493 RepID=A0A9P6LA96_9AGAM|nr:hypothetical protein BJ322DRAFT_1037327 [Thelephora terrestris]
MFLQKVILLAATFASAVWAQFDTAQCGTGFDWNKNSLGQDPCIVGSKLDASCRGLAVYTYTPLNASQYYLPPQTNRSGDVMCDCNTVMYSFFMACTSCQNGTIYSWTKWIAQCVNISISQYPVDIAQGTALPRWAFINVTSLPNMTYSDTVAMSVGRDPEALPNSITTVSMVSTSTTGISTLTKNSTDLPVPTNVNDTAKSDNTGAIVGGVVGTVVPLTILAVVAFLYARKCRQQQVQPNGRQANDPCAEYGPSSPFIPFSQYNPNDPSTSPPNLSGPGRHTNTARRTYSGAAEV